jgi:hypothetical protein
MKLLGNEDLPLDSLSPMPGNPNAMDEDERQRLRDSLMSFGVLEPLIIRVLPGGVRSIVGGYHRWDELCKLHAQGNYEPDTVPCRLVECSDRDAIKANLALNSIHGDFVAPLLSASLEALLDGVDEVDVAGILVGSGFDMDALAEIIAEAERDISRDADSDVGKGAGTGGNGDVGPGEPPVVRPTQLWTEKTFSLSDDMKIIVDEALAKARKLADTDSDGAALCYALSDFLATPEESFQ